MLSIGYLLLVAKSMPYSDPSSNATKLSAEATLAFILLCTLAMRSNLVGEYIGVDEYAELMVLATLLGNVLPSLTSMLSAFQLYFETLTYLLETLSDSDESRSKVKSDSWILGCLTCAGPKKFVSNLKLIMGKMYSYGVQLTCSLNELNDDMTSGVGGLLATAVENAVDDAMENAVEKAQPQKTATENAAGEGLKEGLMERVRSGSDGTAFGANCPFLYEKSATSMQVIKFGALDQHLFKLSQMSKEKKYRPLQDKLQTEKSVGTQFLTGLGYTEALWDNDDQPAKPLEKDFEKLEDCKATATLLGFNANNWSFYMSDKRYSAAVQDRADRKEYMVQQISTTSVKVLQKFANSTREDWKGTNLPPLQEDDILDPLARAWKNACRESAQQYVCNSLVQH
jgi:hypothetical protein